MDIDHKVFSIERAAEVLGGFDRDHRGHEGFEVKTGTFAVFMACPQCDILDTLCIDNDEYREARGQLKHSRAVVF